MWQRMARDGTQLNQKMLDAVSPPPSLALGSDKQGVDVLTSGSSLGSADTGLKPLNLGNSDLSQSPSQRWTGKRHEDRVVPVEAAVVQHLPVHSARAGVANLAFAQQQ